MSCNVVAGCGKESMASKTGEWRARVPRYPRNTIPSASSTMLPSSNQHESDLR